MHWTEIATIILLVLFAIPVLLLLRTVGWIVWTTLTERFQKQKEPSRFQTPFGEFIKTGPNSNWEGFVTIGNTETQVLANDIDGRPDPELLAFIPSIMEDMPVLDGIVRRDVPDVSEKHYFGLITSPESEADFTLGYSYEEDAWGETVFVDFRGQGVVNWYVAD